MHIWLDGDATSSIEARDAVSRPAAEIAFTPLVLWLSVRDKVWPGGFLILPNERSGLDPEKLSEASGASAVFQGHSVSLCWLTFYLGTGYLSNMGGRKLKILPD